MPGLFILSIFLGATLLFAVQPLLGKILLPHLGGSPAVWNTCLVFFQGVLLLGYLYCHLSTKLLGLRRQALFHLLLVVAVFFTLPFTSPTTHPSDPIVFWLIATLATLVGLPFFVISTTSPLLQRWYSATRFVGARDPYFLSIASNLGSLLALLAYPFLIESTWTLSEQSNYWRWGYAVYALLAGACALILLKRYQPAEEKAVLSEEEREKPPSSGQILRWVILSFVPSSLLVGVTQTVTTDIAPIPLLWVVPLAIYLLTFILAFLPGMRWPLGAIGKATVMCIIALALTMLRGATDPMALVLCIHFGGLFAIAFLCHAQLANERPSPTYLTNYYLWMSLGGVLGSAFNALLAPIVFHSVGFIEYPLMIVVGCALRPVAAQNRGFRPGDLIAPLLLGGITFASLKLTDPANNNWLKNLAESNSLPFDMVRFGLSYGIPIILSYVFVERPIRFALGIGSIFLASSIDPGMQGKPLLIERNFFGVVKITTSPEGDRMRMVHGNTIHGEQRITTRPPYTAAMVQTFGAASPMGLASVCMAGDGRWDERHRPLTYYYPTGPAGKTFRYLIDGWKGKRRIGAVGLGTGALASYARPNQDWTFYELDPAVEKLARDDRFFTFLRDTPAHSMNVVIGDARLRLLDEPDGTFDLLVLDAFSSDAIPIHLLTSEAFELYSKKLAPGGVILIHISNRYLDLAPIVAKLGVSQSPPFVVRENNDTALTDHEKEEVKYPSYWMVLARSEGDLGVLNQPRLGWSSVKPSDLPAWTDDKANIIQALRENDPE
jgi:hypothetical protein